jgi:protein phosphatase
VDTIALEREKHLRLAAAAYTDLGQRREVNEDAVFQRTDQLGTGQSVGLYMVCDGVGGHLAGEIASRLALDTVTGALAWLFPAPGASSAGAATRLPDSAVRQRLQAAIGQAHIALRGYAETHPAQAPDLSTTMVLALIYRSRAHIANVGDSRAYAWRAGYAVQITRDHSLAAELAERGHIDRSEIANHPRGNVLLRALGVGEDVEVDLFGWSLQAGDRLLLCSDGLWRAFPDPAELATWLGGEGEVDAVCRRLVEEANRRDGSDNISAVLVRAEVTH